MYKMVQMNKKGYKKCGVEIIDKGRYVCANRIDLEVESDVANWTQIFNKCDLKTQKYRPQLAPNAEY